MKKDGQLSAVMSIKRIYKGKKEETFSTAEINLNYSEIQYMYDIRLGLRYTSRK